MRAHEGIAAARRIGPLYAELGGSPVTGENFNGAGELEISIAGSAWAAPAGTISAIGGGWYYYQCTAVEATVPPWVAIKLAGVCDEFTFREDVTEAITGIKRSEPESALRRVGPLFAGLSDTPVTGEVFDGAGELEISINGATWIAATGRITELSEGYYYYTPDVLEIGSHGWIAIKIDGVCDQFVLREDISIPYPVIANAATAASIRDRICALIEGVTPSVLSGDRLRRYRAELGANFDDEMEKQPSGALRRFSVRESGDDEIPLASNISEEIVRSTFEIRIAYPQTHRYGADNGYDRDDCIRSDWKAINYLIGIYGRGSFTGSYDCTPLGATMEREMGSGGVDYMVVTAQYEYRRSTT